MSTTLSDSRLHQLKESIRQAALALGFDAVGFTSADPLEDQRDLWRWWLKEGYAGTMQWLLDSGERRLDPRSYWPQAQSVIVVALNYFRSSEPLERPAQEGNISLYARGRDYHRVLRKKLKHLLRQIQQWVPEAEGRPAVDSFPLAEKPLAVRAGLGWQGKHTNVILKGRGSYFFLGELLLNLPLPPDSPFEHDHCGTCTRCIEACPTRAIVAPYVLDARRCISYLTIEHQGEIDPALQPGMGNWVFGCDICQAVCPWNRFATDTREGDFASRVPEWLWSLEAQLALSEAQFLKIFEGTPVRRAGYRRWQRNVRIALANAAQTPRSSSCTSSRQG